MLLAVHVVRNNRYSRHRRRSQYANPKYQVVMPVRISPVVAENQTVLVQANVNKPVQAPQKTHPRHIQVRDAHQHQNHLVLQQIPKVQPHALTQFNPKLTPKSNYH